MPNILQLPLSVQTEQQEVNVNIQLKLSIETELFHVAQVTQNVDLPIIHYRQEKRSNERHLIQHHFSSFSASLAFFLSFLKPHQWPPCHFSSIFPPTKSLLLLKIFKNLIKTLLLIKFPGLLYLLLRNENIDVIIYYYN